MKAWLFAIFAQVFLSAEERSLIATLRTPARWLPEPDISEQEAESWGAMLKSPLMQKIDVAMINIAQQEAQRAITAPASEMQRMAGHAIGIRNGWQLAKQISRLFATKREQTEAAVQTGAASLEHLSP
jgi:hypothetical protein